MTTLKNPRVLWTIPLLIAVCLISFPAYAKYGGGTGEPNDPYQISTAGDLMLLGESPEDYDKYFILTANIDLDPNLPGRKVFDKAVIAPDTNDVEMGFQGTSFAGDFDGNDHTISHLTIVGERYLGLFGQLDSSAVISNLCLEAADFNGTRDYVGGLVGDNDGGSVTNCYSTGTVSGFKNVGGLVGNNHGTITMSYSTGTVSGFANAGGLVGDNDRDGSITASYSTGTVTGSNFVGGLVGQNEGSISASYSTGTVSENWHVGGLVGGNRGDVSITSSFWDVETSGQATSDGGTGLTTAEMQDIGTFLSEGWDFVDEIENGTHETWQMPEAGGYPVLAVFSGYTPPQLQGQGTAEDPYLISDAIELGAIVHYSPYAHYRLAAPIDLSGIRWGKVVIPSLRGTFDGNNLTISHLTIECGYDGYDLGLFGKLEFGAEVRNLGVVDVNIAVSDDYVVDVYSYYAEYHTGGLVAKNSGSVSQCYSTGTVSGTKRVGGLVGSNDGTITTSYNTCAVTGDDLVGGLVGLNISNITTSYSTGTVTGSSEGVGGLVGRNVGAITNCYATGSVSGVMFVGGLVGNNISNITRSYSTGTVRGTVRGTSIVGGLVGSNTSQWGNDGTVTRSFWDTQTSGRAASAGSTGLTTSKMQTASTFLDAGWDFEDESENGTEDIWWILEGQDYPRLWWEAEEP